MGTIKIPAADVLKKIYGETEESSARYTNLAVNFEKKYHHDKAEFFTAPGRTEIIGNHVDHNGGQIIAASIDLDTIGAAYPNGTNVIHMISEGYKQEVVVDLDKLSTETYTKGTDALVAGIMEYMQKKGYATGGFDAYVSTKVIAAAGVSSSASFEMLVCAITNYFFNEGKLEYGEYARAGQYAENVYWKKASGLMDQMACAAGGPILLDFSDKENISCEKIAFSFEDMGCRLVIGISIEVSACIGAILLVLTGVISEKDALNSIDLKVVFLFGGSLTLAKALDTTGAGELIADKIVGLLGADPSPILLLLVIFIVTCVLTNFMSNTATTALMIPIAVSLANNLGADPRAVVIATVIAGSCAYATPIGMPANTMVVGLGGYKFKDYVKSGLPLILVSFVICMILLPILFPFYP